MIDSGGVASSAGNGVGVKRQFAAVSGPKRGVSVGQKFRAVENNLHLTGAQAAARIQSDEECDDNRTLEPSSESDVEMDKDTELDAEILLAVEHRRKLETKRGAEQPLPPGEEADLLSRDKNVTAAAVELWRKQYNCPGCGPRVYKAKDELQTLDRGNGLGMGSVLAIATHDALGENWWALRDAARSIEYVTITRDPDTVELMGKKLKRAIVLDQVGGISAEGVLELMRVCRSSSVVVAGKLLKESWRHCWDKFESCVRACAEACKGRDLRCEFFLEGWVDDPETVAWVSGALGRTAV